MLHVHLDQKTRKNTCDRQSSEEIPVNFVLLWIRGIVHPLKTFAELKNKPAPLWGLRAVLTRFVGGSAIGVVLLFLLPNRRPFERPYFTFLSEETYYTAQIFISPLFGIGIWLLMCSIVHLILRTSGKASDFDKILNIIGFGMLVPMPIVWI